MITKPDKEAVRARRHARIRRQLSGTAARPRLNVFRSDKHIYAQMIDDVSGTTIVSASTVEKSVRESVPHGNTVAAAEAIGELVAKRAVEKGISKVVFDRGGYLYHGRIQALADAARKAGLEF
ncbi:MAG: 50S ribosomal protein L18 [Acidibacillus sp.]|uniref:Large ribosomal subunit protein uL18 n=1 Tax=Sulfoacidibacillus ferrooxidans TaxID=2005001 RepID=A0A9X1VD09_9BACL|nr:50S ribosomal protein L18 [Sulfoacidibacillus ferrooxidans]MCI0183832.1 50S ribosomal protein L18 [Sulfoacidibacillus ferrooxidans]MCY0893692.1 50S ribosomal protein L18 [Acidibacillus sp.]